ncbi:MAG: DUF3368 domain-containing protein [Oscillospiraceae bacterium]|nr:DUF3368 domain-containing protein [Oscillospiraceae bacterium]
MHNNIISNTSCLIILSNINRLNLLHDVYETIMITDEVAVEYGDSLPKWITVEPVKDKEKTKIISSGLGIGESSTIALALEQKNALIILDDKKARRLAKEYELSVTGTLGVVVKAKNMGFIVDIQSVLNDFKQYGFWIPYDIEQFLLS